jgi:predicted aspartyl protease
MIFVRSRFFVILVSFVICVIGRWPVRIHAAADPIRVPFAWTPGQIEVRVRVNDVNATFLLDTGAEYSVISTRLAGLLKVQTDRTRGRDFADDISLTLGGVSLEHQRVMVMPFDTYYARGRTIDGLVGYDFFARFVVSIDFNGHSLTLWEPSAFKPRSAAVVVPIELSGRLPVVSSTLVVSEGRRLPVRLLVDTGASQAIILRYPFANTNGLLDLVKDVEASTTRAPSLASGELQLVDVPVEQVSLARWTFDRPRVQAHREPTGSGAATDTDGLIGNTLLQRFRLTVDYQRKRLLLEPVRHAAKSSDARISHEDH